MYYYDYEIDKFQFVEHITHHSTQMGAVIFYFSSFPPGQRGNGQFDRSSNTWRIEQMHSALLRAVSGEDYTPEKTQ